MNKKSAEEDLKPMNKTRILFRAQLEKKIWKATCLCQMHTTDTEATRSYIIIPASARATLAHDITTGRSPARRMDKIHQHGHSAIKLRTRLPNKNSKLQVHKILKSSLYLISSTSKWHQLNFREFSLYHYRLHSLLQEGRSVSSIHYMLAYWPGTN